MRIKLSRDFGISRRKKERRKKWVKMNRIKRINQRALLCLILYSSGDDVSLWCLANVKDTAWDKAVVPVECLLDFLLSSLFTVPLVNDFLLRSVFLQLKRMIYSTPSRNTTSKSSRVFSLYTSSCTDDDGLLWYYWFEFSGPDRWTSKLVISTWVRLFDFSKTPTLSTFS